MNLATFDLNLLKAADALLTERSVTRAAERVGITQQGMSGQLKRLREIFDDQLLVQSGRALLPTALGRTLAGPVRDVLARVERALSIAPNEHPARSRRAFVIAATPDIGTRLFPAVAADLSGRLPLARMSARLTDTGCVTDLEDGRSDLCLMARHRREEGAGLPDEIRIEPLFEEDYVCLMDRRRTPTGGLDRAAYAAGRHALAGADDRPTAVQNQWRREGLSLVVALQQPSVSDVLLSIPDTDLIATVGRRLASYWADRLDLDLHPVPFPIEPVSVEMLWHVRDDSDPAHAALRDIVRRHGETNNDRAVGTNAPIVVEAWRRRSTAGARVGAAHSGSRN